MQHFHDLWNQQFIADRHIARHIIIMQCRDWISASINYIYIYIYILSAVRNATISSCGCNETWSHDTKTYTTFRHSACCFPAANRAWFWYLWLSYKVFCLSQVTVGVRGNVVLLGRPSNCKQEEGLVCVGRSACSMESPRKRRRLDRERRHIVWALGCFWVFSWREFWC